MRKRPNWNDYFLGIAFVASQRSQDSETQHGCVIVNKHNHIVSIGYNGFPKGMKDENLPSKRPEKYPWCLHSERNAIANSEIRPDGCTAYVTGECCNDCLMAMWQSGITRVVQADRHGTKLENDETRKIKERFLKETGMSVVTVKYNLEWIKEIL